METIETLIQEAHNAFKANNLADAEAILDKIITIDPSNAAAYNILGLIASRERRNAKAFKYFKLAASLSDNDPKIYHNFATHLQLNSQYVRAAHFYEKAIALKPDYTAALNNYCSVLTILGELNKSESQARHAISLNASQIEPLINLANCLKDQGRIDEAIDCYREALKINPEHPVAGSNLLLCLNYSDLDPGSIFFEHRQWESRQRLIHTAITYPPRHLDPDKTPLRIGYVSADFKTHSVAFFIEAILRRHDRSAFEIYCYSDVGKPDPVTIRLKNFSLVWRSIYNKTNEEVSALIIEDRIDILVDLAGHAGNKRIRLFLNRLAPVQVTYLGYPNTTGISTMDYRLTDALADPRDADRFHTEKLYRLAGGFLCYTPPVNSPALKPPPVCSNGYITFGSFNNLPKINDTTITVWAAILDKVPHARLFIKTKAFNDSIVKQRYLDRFFSKGVDPTRLHFTGYASSLQTHLETYNEIDIALDTFPYNGTTTTFEALWMGAPVITLEGKSHAARVGASIMNGLGLQGMITQSFNKYQALAGFLARDIRQLSKLRMTLRNALAQSALCNGAAFTFSLEKAYRDIWREKLAQSHDKQGR